MALERGYYYRVRREDGRVVREYVGGGLVGEMAARLDALEREKGREKRRQDAEALRHVKATLDALDANLEALIESTDLLAHAALVADGYHQHKRGEWRKRRDHSDENP
jgi:hypothetical protein